MRARTAAAMVLLVAGCGPEGPSDLEAALCSDLDGGASLFQMVTQVQDHYQEQGRSDPRASAAVFIDDTIREHCPDHVDAWEATALYDEFY